jgi:hypothetical protein
VRTLEMTKGEKLIAIKAIIGNPWAINGNLSNQKFSLFLLANRLIWCRSFFSDWVHKNFVNI